MSLNSHAKLWIHLTVKLRLTKALLNSKSCGRIRISIQISVLFTTFRCLHLFAYTSLH